MYIFFYMTALNFFRVCPHPLLRPETLPETLLDIASSSSKCLKTLFSQKCQSVFACKELGETFPDLISKSDNLLHVGTQRSKCLKPYARLKPLDDRFKAFKVSISLLKFLFHSSLAPSPLFSNPILFTLEYLAKKSGWAQNNLNHASPTKRVYGRAGLYIRPHFCMKFQRLKPFHEAIAYGWEADDGLST